MMVVLILTRFSQVAHENIAACGGNLVCPFVNIIVIIFHSDQQQHYHYRYHPNDIDQNVQ